MRYIGIGAGAYVHGIIGDYFRILKQKAETEFYWNIRFVIIFCVNPHV